MPRIWFLFIYSVAFKTDKSSDFFSPIKFVSLIFIIRNVPYIFFTAFDEEYFNPYLLFYFDFYNKMSLEDAFIKYAIVQTIAFVCLILGLKLYAKKTNFISKNYYKSKLNYQALKLTVFICFFIGLGGYIYFLNDVGGLAFLLDNLNDRINIQSGQYTLQLRPFMSFATIFSILLIRLGGNKTSDKVLFLTFLTISILVFSSTGGRKDSMYLIVMSVAAYYYYLKGNNINLIDKAKLILVGSLVFVYIFIIPVIRSKDGLNLLNKGEINFIELIGVGGFFSNLSYTYIDVFAINHFDESNTWNFSSFLTIPSNIFDRKEAELRPPIDEGMYFVSSIVWGGDYKPLIPRNELREFSFPIENMGFAYANALLPGVIISFFLLGIIYRYIYNKFIRSGYNSIWLFIYLFSVFNLNFSSLRIVTFVVIILLLYLYTMIYKFSETILK